jgi:hypothetical protein
MQKYHPASMAADSGFYRRKKTGEKVDCPYRKRKPRSSPIFEAIKKRT